MAQTILDDGINVLGSTWANDDLIHLVTPICGPTDAPTDITIDITGYTPPADAVVLVGTTAATNVVVSGQSITATVPAGASGLVTVNGRSTGDTFVSAPAPDVGSVPPSVPAGGTMMITGYNLTVEGLRGLPEVLLGDVPLENLVFSANGTQDIIHGDVPVTMSPGMYSVTVHHCGGSDSSGASQTEVTAPEVAAAAAEPDDDDETFVSFALEDMTVAQLREYAAENGIGLGSLTLKADIIDRIESALPEEN